MRPRQIIIISLRSDGIFQLICMYFIFLLITLVVVNIGSVSVSTTTKSRLAQKQNRDASTFFIYDTYFV